MAKDVLTFDSWYTDLERYFRSYRYHKKIVRDTFIEDYDNGATVKEAASRYLLEKGYEV